ncbi:hypothetical protein [Fulvivirga lutea]|uniref:Uncharacterized protein n=1 Tax=Fulvivirga lutea TaxID=2810512 RepID=A0A974WIQ8_9BACT|nr:hypothetical protein [Fulvivirga lutea]QSE98644.1 hypothetical protein JR347_06080 [Fulvivirga lutea]
MSNNLTYENYDLNPGWMTFDYIRNKVYQMNSERSHQVGNILRNHFKSYGYLPITYIKECISINDKYYRYESNIDYSENISSHLGTLTIRSYYDEKRYDLLMKHYVSIKEAAIPMKYIVSEEDYPFDFDLTVCQKYNLVEIVDDLDEHHLDFNENSNDWWDSVELALRWNKLW